MWRVGDLWQGECPRECSCDGDPEQGSHTREGDPIREYRALPAAAYAAMEAKASAYPDAMDMIRSLARQLAEAEARLAALVEAADAILRRSTCAIIDPSKCVDPAEWIGVCVKEFDALSAALTALNSEP